MNHVYTVLRVNSGFLRAEQDSSIMLMHEDVHIFLHTLDHTYARTPEVKKKN